MFSFEHREFSVSLWISSVSFKLILLLLKIKMKKRNGSENGSMEKIWPHLMELSLSYNWGNTLKKYRTRGKIFVNEKIAHARSDNDARGLGHVLKLWTQVKYVPIRHMNGNEREKLELTSIHVLKIRKYLLLCSSFSNNEPTYEYDFWRRYSLLYDDDATFYLEKTQMGKLLCKQNEKKVH